MPISQSSGSKSSGSIPQSRAKARISEAFPPRPSPRGTRTSATARSRSRSRGRRRSGARSGETDEEREDGEELGETDSDDRDDYGYDETASKAKKPSKKTQPHMNPLLKLIGRGVKAKVTDDSPADRGKKRN